MGRGFDGRSLLLGGPAAGCGCHLMIGTAGDWDALVVVVGVISAHCACRDSSFLTTAD